MCRVKFVTELGLISRLFSACSVFVAIDHYPLWSGAGAQGQRIL